jgi:histone acetyltransferase (RNA polymerase elongator complex component)
VRISVTSGIQRADAHEFYRRIGYAQTGLRFGKAL